MVGTDPRGRYAYAVEVPLSGGEHWHELAVALTPEAAGDLVRAIMACGGPEPHSVRVAKRPLD
jgi:hypothetical protein